jgi:hypothetical protein
MGLIWLGSGAKFDKKKLRMLLQCQYFFDMVATLNECIIA